MGSTMKPTIFNERIANALRRWHQSAKKHIKQNRHSGSVTPTSAPDTPSHAMSPVHLLRNYKVEPDTVQTSPRKFYFDNESWETGSPHTSLPKRQNEVSPSHHHSNHGLEDEQRNVQELTSTYIPSVQHANRFQHEIDITDFSFDRQSKK